MKKNVSLVFLVLVSQLVLSCFKELGIEEVYQPRMVLTGVLVPGREVEVHLGANYPSGDSAVVKPITKATVELFCGSELIGALTHTTDGRYTLAYTVLKGERYTLKAHSDGYPSIEAKATIPSYEFKSNEIITVGNVGQYTLPIAVNMPAIDYPAYFAIIVYLVSVDDESYNGDGSIIVNSQRIFQFDNSLDRVVEFFESYSDYRDRSSLKDFTYLARYQELKTYFPDNSEKSTGTKYTVFFSNELFINAPYQVQLTSLLNSMPFRPINRNFCVNIYQLSPELYMAFRGIAAQESTKRELFVSPVPAFNSIEGGLGYFGGCLVYRVELGDIAE
jgi:hypothetical protein